MTKAELEVLYMRVVGALDKEFRERGWLPPAQPTWSPSEEILIWLDEQIEEAKRQQIHAFRNNNVAGERAWARHCALYEVRQKIAPAVTSGIRGGNDGQS